MESDENESVRKKMFCIRCGEEILRHEPYFAIQKDIRAERYFFHGDELQCEAIQLAKTATFWPASGKTCQTWEHFTDLQKKTLIDWCRKELTK
ncbi:hypothetical protein HWC80_gp078 [Mycobacterium phage Indlulamithi]|uniref:Uncharacterized protein n=1 Tax=Mycobacterium phage Indlulamithi TaxID=2656582 RepID=A0A649VD52_9CAUD|nr:hypothetical protein HWC80_gp078 [Mycobacterium phage Indlulamithi]QGJ90134.1 hypothetical protein PBI_INDLULAMITHI_96 [Mycobacterium phage Indlulamithi]